MKHRIFLSLTIALTTTAVQAESIDMGGVGGTQMGLAGAPSTANKVCTKVVFITRNSGTLVTGLNTSHIKLYKAIEQSESLTGAGMVSHPVTFTYTLAASTTPSQAGLYDFCLTPSGFVWKQPPNVGYNYAVSGIVTGMASTDHGAFTLVLQ